MILFQFLPEVTKVKGSDLPDELLYGRAGANLVFILNTLVDAFYLPNTKGNSAPLLYHNGWNAGPS